jgi:3-hydroxyisobutyrate dehydrogenase-like beta-hydroxyacid dehydrogenase
MRLAFIGLGAIGLPMARRVALHPDVEMAIFDTRPDVLEAEAALGRVASSIPDAVDGADVVFSVLPADPHVRDVGAEIAAAANAGQIFLDFSTIAPSTIDAVGAAETGELSIFVGGDGACIDRIRPALDQMATDVRAVATPGAAKALKILNNMQVSSLDLVICDGLLVGAAHGVEAARVVDSLTRNGADSWPLRNHIAKHLLVDDLAPGRFSTRYMGKDAALAAALAEHHDEPAAFAGLVTAAYRGTDALGFGEHYHPVVMRWFERTAGAQPVTPSTLTQREGEASEAEATVCRGVVAQQALISFDALRLVAREGVPVAEALEHFDSGSASNDTVRALLGTGPARLADLTLREIVDDLRAVCSLAAAAPVPALTFEVGKHVALSWASRFGAECTLSELVVRIR